MDSPSQRQLRLAHADPLTSDMKAFPHGSSSEVRKGLETPPDPALETECLTKTAQSMERGGVEAPPGGIFPESVKMPHCNIRWDGIFPGVSQPRGESLQLPDEDLRMLLSRAQVPQ